MKMLLRMICQGEMYSLISGILSSSFTVRIQPKIPWIVHSIISPFSISPKTLGTWIAKEEIVERSPLCSVLHSFLVIWGTPYSLDFRRVLLAKSASLSASNCS